MKLFFTAFTQVFLISINTYFISRTNYQGAIVTTFFINMLWTYNVRKISVGSIKDSLKYATGASFGVILGIYLATKL
jgi:hypothetical protein